MTRGGDRKGAGRPPVPEAEKKKMYSTKLRPEQIAWLRATKNAAALIERLIDAEIEKRRLNGNG